MKYLKLLVLSIAAGVCIGFGGMLNIMCIANKLNILGGILFSVGLFLICVFGFKLFTGQVGYLFAKENKLSFLKELLIFYIGNVIGAVGFGSILRLTGILENDVIENVATELAQHKLVRFNAADSFGQTFYSMLILAFFCGVLVFLAVDIFRRENIHPFVRTLGLIVCVGAFVISGFEHCVADMFYLGFSGDFFTAHALNALVSILLGSTGNILGAFATYFVVNLATKK